MLSTSRSVLSDGLDYVVAAYGWLKSRKRLRVQTWIKSFQAWRHYQSVDPLDVEQPWLTFAAADYLNRTITPNMRIFEWGSGGSSLYFVRRAARVVSVEHDHNWFWKVQNAMAQRGINNWEGFLVEPSSRDAGHQKNACDSESYFSSDPRWCQHSFKDYAAFIDRYPDGYFDVCLVDGRARPSCVKHALSKVKEGGVLMLDNSERDEYQDAIKMMDRGGWQKKEFNGPGPYNRYFWSTHVWERFEFTYVANKKTWT